MNIIHILLIVMLWLITISNGKLYFQLRDEHIRSGEEESSPNYKNAKKEFISFLITAIIYTLIKIL